MILYKKTKFSREAQKLVRGINKIRGKHFLQISHIEQGIFLDGAGNIEVSLIVNKETEIVICQYKVEASMEGIGNHQMGYVCRDENGQRNSAYEKIIETIKELESNDFVVQIDGSVEEDSSSEDGSKIEAMKVTRKVFISDAMRILVDVEFKEPHSLATIYAATEQAIPDHQTSSKYVVVDYEGVLTCVSYEEHEMLGLPEIPLRRRDTGIHDQCSWVPFDA